MGRMLNLFWPQESTSRYYYQFCILSLAHSNLLDCLDFSSYKDFIFASISFRLFKEYEERYLFLFDLDLKPEGEVLRPNFNSERELLLLKEHFL